MHLSQCLKIAFYTSFCLLFSNTFGLEAATANETLADVCSTNPIDLRCSGYQSPQPIKLKKRQGIKAYCTGALTNQKSDKCRILLDENTITFFYKVEGKGSLTSQLAIPLEVIEDLSYPEYTEITNFGLFGLLNTKNKTGVLEVTFRSSESEVVDLHISSRGNRDEFSEFIASVAVQTNYESQTYVDNSSFVTLTTALDQSQEAIDNPSSEIILTTSNQPPETFDRDLILTQKNCQGCDLQGINLDDSELDDVVLDEANLRQASFVGSDMEGASLWRTDLEGANFYQTELSSSGDSRTDFRQASLIDANMQEAILRGANFNRANLQGANLAGADLSSTGKHALIFGGQTKVKLHTHLTGANLQGANLETADLRRAIIKHSNLDNASFRNANLSEATLDNSSFQNADFTEADLEDASLRGANLQEANFTGAELDDTSFERANLQGAIIQLSKIKPELLCSATLPDGSAATLNCEEED